MPIFPLDRIFFTKFCFETSGKLDFGDLLLNPELVPLETISVILGKLLNLSELEFNHLKNEHNYICLIELAFIEVVMLF